LKRSAESLRSSAIFDLPDVGEALDFGCGNGVFTDVIKRALPTGWKVYGTDISEIAIENVKKRYPECVFFVADDEEFISKRFDFLFTHHVLEHVYNLAQVLKKINDRLKDESTILHILPCGNEGSFEHSICLLRKDGINKMRFQESLVSFLVAHRVEVALENRQAIRAPTNAVSSIIMLERS